MEKGFSGFSPVQCFVTWAIYIQCIVVISDLQWVICGTLTIHGRMCWLNVQWIWTMVKPHGVYSDDHKLRSMVVAWGNYCIYCPVVVIL